MRILVITLGTRGDVQPYMALGLELQARGHSVTICTSASFKPFILEHGLGYAHMDDGFMQLLDSIEGRAALEHSQNIWQLFNSYLRLIPRMRPMQRQIFDDAWAATLATAPDLIIAHPKSAWAVDFGDQLKVPVVMSAFQPVLVPTRDFPSLALPRLPLGGAYNRASYRLVNALIVALEGKHVNTWRCKVGLGTRRRGRGLLQTLDGKAVPVLHAFSDLVVPTPRDWPDSAHAAGFWFLEEPPNWHAPEALRAFLAAGETPVYIGFGSMAGRQPERMGALISEALKLAKVRAIVATGRGGIASIERSDKILQIDSAPHAWLFPKVAAVVHHGGAGTTAAGLRAGRPGVICPFFGDQPYWGQRVFELGVGSAPIAQSKLTAARLADALQLVTTDHDMAERAQALGLALQRESGTARAADFIEAKGLMIDKGGAR